MINLALMLVAVLWAPCTSTWSSDLDLSARNISAVPACLPANVSACDNTTVECDYMNSTLECSAGLEQLDLSRNNIAVLQSGVFGELGELIVLNLSGNALKCLDSECFAGLNKLEQLDLSANSLPVLEGAVLSGLGQLLRLNLSWNSLTSLNSKCFSGLKRLQQLDVSMNCISVLEGEPFSDLGELLRLNVSGNRLETLSSGSFRGLTRLQQLDASHNRISSVSPGTFQPVAALTQLLLADNPVLGLTVLVGTGRKLQTVDASRAGLSQVPAALTTSIRTLRLAGNVMTAVRCGDLDSYPLLRFLDLSDNAILELEEDALGRLEILMTLYLSGNKLRTVPRSLPAGLTSLHLQRNSIQQLASGELQGLPRLRYLSLRESGLRVIQNGALGQLPALQTLDLSLNPLTRLPGNALSGPLLTVLKLSSLIAIPTADTTELSFPVTSPERLEVLELDSSPELARQLLADTAALAAFRQLRELDLSRDNLTILRSDLFHFLPRLRVLRLAGNPWSCEHMGWLADWVRHNQQELQESLQDAVCASPDYLVSTPVMDLLVTTPRYDTSLYPGDNATFAAENTTDFSTDVPDQSESSKPLTDLYSVLTTQHRFNLSSGSNRQTQPSRHIVQADAPQSIRDLFNSKPNLTNSSALEGENLVFENATLGIGDKSVYYRSRASDAYASGVRVTVKEISGSHPGMFVLLGLGLAMAGALAVAMSHCAKKRRRQAVEYSRQQDIEVRSMSSIGDLW